MSNSVRFCNDISDWLAVDVVKGISDWLANDVVTAAFPFGRKENKPEARENVNTYHCTV